MSNQSNLTPLHKHALRVGLQSQDHGFHRCRGGYIPVSGERTIFTTRTIRAMEREGLISYRDQFAELAVLTPEGVKAAEQLRGAAQARAGAA